jgi:hypothetical protein
VDTLKHLCESDLLDFYVVVYDPSRFAPELLGEKVEFVLQILYALCFLRQHELIAVLAIVLLLNIEVLCFDLPVLVVSLGK